MLAQRLNLGPTPLIDINRCHANLDVRGWDREETVVESDDHDFEMIPQEGGAAIQRIDDHTTIRIPVGGRLRIGRIDGNVQAKDVRGEVAIERVEGSFLVRRVGPLNIGKVAGHVRLRDVDGPVTLGRVEGHVNLRDIAGPVAAEQVSGHFSADYVPAGITVGRIDGNLLLRTPFNPETAFDFTVSGNVIARMPQESNVRLIVQASGSVHANRDFQLYKEGSERILVLGSGSATVKIVAEGSVRLSVWEDYRDDDTSAGFDDFSERLEDAFSRLDTHFAEFEPNLDALPDRVRGRVARKLEAARRRIEDAHRHAEQVMESAWRDAGTPAAIPRSYTPNEPVSEGERLLILQMLEQGKITVQEAETLLAALEGRS